MERPAHRLCSRSCLTLALLIAVAAGLTNCRRADTANAERCGTCHGTIELASATHSGCISCHGGDPSAENKAAAHAGMYGANDLSSAERWERGCGPCHLDQVGRMTSSQMFTNSGMIAQIQATWDSRQRNVRRGAVAGTRFAPDGSPMTDAPVATLDDLSGELYRKFCSRCHLARANDEPDSPGHPAGCAACHFPSGDGDTYEGGDDTVRGTGPHSATHTMHGLPPMAACERCHNRSGRTSLSYRGLQDGNNALVPTTGGMPGPLVGGDGRNFTHIAPDVHFEAGMECIDCHTSREIMGDGYAHENMGAQLEIGCTDCHGDAIHAPRFVELTRESDSSIRESRQYARPLTPGMRVALTGKGRPYSNVFERGGTVFVTTKRQGKILKSPVITGTPAHTIAGHERIECAACHSRAVPQCYGCHTSYDRREEGWDFVKDEGTPGIFAETEDYRTLYPFPLAINGRGGIAPVTPGCQTFVTVIEPDGSRSKNESIARYGDKPQFRFVPFYAHNSSRSAVGCAECHGNPAFLGFGQHVIEGGAIRSTMLCERNPRKGLDAFLSMDRGRVVSHAAIARTGARALDHDEVRRVLSVNLCIVCHSNADDPIYHTRLDHDALDDALHRRLLADRQ